MSPRNPHAKSLATAPKHDRGPIAGPGLTHRHAAAHPKTTAGVAAMIRLRATSRNHR